MCQRNGALQVWHPWILWLRRGSGNLAIVKSKASPVRVRWMWSQFHTSKGFPIFSLPRSPSESYCVPKIKIINRQTFSVANWKVSSLSFFLNSRILQEKWKLRNNITQNKLSQQQDRRMNSTEDLCGGRLSFSVFPEWGKIWGQIKVRKGGFEVSSKVVVGYPEI